MNHNYRMLNIAGIVVLLTAGMFCPAAFGGTTSRFNIPAKKLYSQVLRFAESRGTGLLADETQLAVYFTKDDGANSANVLFRNFYIVNCA